jgi:oligopeptide/dipeptide ABC transporter ATP-binding protein
MTNGALMKVDALSVAYRRAWRKASSVKAVDGVSFEVQAGETVGLVGESGSGKSTIGRAILGLAPVSHGAIFFEDNDITHASPRERRELSRHLQVVFQDPYSSLNPSRSIRETLIEPLLIHEKLTKREADARVSLMLGKVGLPSDAARRYPSQFSGGQRQRVAIARALMLSPKLVICDEPVSALDLSIQAQVLNLLRDLQIGERLSYLFIAHDLAVVRHLSRRTIVLYQGRIMESGLTQLVHDRPAHPYTRALLAAAPVADPAEQARRRARRTRRAADPREVPGESACPFAPRCPFAVTRCWTEAPLLEPAPDGTEAACHRKHELPPWDLVSRAVEPVSPHLSYDRSLPAAEKNESTR